MAQKIIPMFPIYQECTQNFIRGVVWNVGYHLGLKSASQQQGDNIKIVPLTSSFILQSFFELLYSIERMWLICFVLNQFKCWLKQFSSNSYFSYELTSHLHSNDWGVEFLSFQYLPNCHTLVSSLLLKNTSKRWGKNLGSNGQQTIK